MAVSRGSHVIEFVKNELDKLTKNPEIYVEPQPEKADRFKHLSEKLYSYAVSLNKNRKGKYLSKLLINGFDPEQIWQQCNLLNKAVVDNISSAVRNINPKDIHNAISKTNRVHPHDLHTNDKNVSPPSENDEDDISNSGASGEEYAFDDDSDSPTEMEAYTQNKPTRNVKKVSNPSEVDDKFFKLSELEEFLKVEDLKEERGIEEDSHDDDDDGIDMFQDIPSDDMGDFDEEDDDEEKPLKSSKDLMYKDFFDDPDAEVGDENDEDDHDEIMNGDSVDGNYSAVEMNHNLEEADNSDEESKLKNKNVQKTAFELEQEKIRKKIQEYEKSMIEPLPWHLTGEVDASKRPVDSLIHKEVDFDSNIKEDLVVDNALTETIEEMVKMAIKNKAFNDVERKYKPTEDVMAYKKETALEQTKSKKSLVEVYEDDYLKKQSKQEDEEDPKHKEIKKLMDSLFPELYALFTHIPVPAVPEVKVVSNLPAVTVEEVAPVTLNDSTLLAPEEVKQKTGQIKSKTERTDTDRKRERRKKKVHQKLKEKKRLEKLESQKGNPSAKVTKLEKLQTLKKLKQHKNTKIASVDDGGKIKSSKDFFSRLQDTMDSKNKTQKFSKKRLK